MLLARVSEEKYASLYRAGKIFGGVFLGKGQEALSAAIGITLQKGDVFAPLIRDQAGRLAFGESLLDATRTYLGSRLGPMRGREGNVHRGNPSAGYLAMISHLGVMISVVCGVLYARRMQGETGIVGVTCLGEGGTSTGSFHEGLNLAAVEKLPLVLVIANNQFAYSTPNSRQFVCRDLVDRAAGYGVAGHSVDATDLPACLKTIELAISQARAGSGPQLVVASLLRLSGHGEHDDASYIPANLKESHLGTDCLRAAEQLLLSRKLVTTDDLVRMRTQAVHEVEESVATAQREPAPDPGLEEWVALSTSNLCDSFPSE